MPARRRWLQCPSCQMPSGHYLQTSPPRCPPRPHNETEFPPSLPPPLPPGDSPTPPGSFLLSEWSLSPQSPIPAHSSPVDPGWFGGQMKCKLPPYATICYTQNRRNRRAHPKMGSDRDRNMYGLPWAAATGGPGFMYYTSPFLDPFSFVSLTVAMLLGTEIMQ